MHPAIHEALLQLRPMIGLAGIACLTMVALTRPKKELFLLWIIAGLGVFTSVRFGEFQPQGIHVHDTWHYQVGSKFFGNVGYTGLYEATVAALYELSKEGKIREERVPKFIRILRNKGAGNEEVTPEKASEWKVKYFGNSPEEWENFKETIRKYEENFSPTWDRMVRDAGYNPSPWWTTIGIMLNFLFRDINSYKVMIHLDSLLIALSFFLLWKTFGVKPALYALSLITFFPQGGLSIYDYIGGSMLRTSWAAFLTLGVCFFHKRVYFWAGAALALSTLERVFPGAFAASAGLILLAQSLSEAKMNKEPMRRAIQPLFSLAAGGLLTTLVVILITFLVIHPHCWKEFLAYIPSHTGVLYTNHFGWNRAISFFPSISEMDFQITHHVFYLWSESLFERNNWLIFIVLRFFLLVGMIFFAWKERNTASTFWLGATIVFLFTMPAQYYLIGLLPLWAAHVHTYPEKTSLSTSLVGIAALINGTGEVLSMALISVLMACPMAYIAGKQLLPYFTERKTKIDGWLGLIFCLFTILFYPQITEPNIIRADPLSVVPNQKTKVIERRFIDTQFSREIKDKGYILNPEDSLTITLDTSKADQNHINIRTDGYFSGRLILRLGESILQSWEVTGAGSFFRTLSTPLPQPPPKTLELIWKGPGKDIAIFSIWTTKHPQVRTNLMDIPLKKDLTNSGYERKF